MKTSTTLMFVGVAVVLGIVALFAVPSSVEPEAYSDQGELFFPEFNNPDDCRELVIYEPNPDTNTVESFNVKFEDGMYRIPSHNGYPADAEERMAPAAAGLIGLKKDIIRSDRKDDQATCSVEDPLDDASSVDGRGKRVVLKDRSGRTIADIIVGKQVESNSSGMGGGGRSSSDWAYMREPDSKRIYAVDMRLNKEGGYGGDLIKDVSTRFSEWIDTDLLHLEKSKVNEIVIQNYSVNEISNSVDIKDKVCLSKNDEDGWILDDLAEGEQVDEDESGTLLRTLDSLLIEGVRPRPEQLTSGSLNRYGFFVNQGGQLFGNEGQMEIFCDDGVIYHLYFGEILFGEGDAVTSGAEGEAPEEEKSAGGMGTENRYLFLWATLDPELEEKTGAAVAAAEEEAVKKAEEEKDKDEEEGEEGATAKTGDKSDTQKEREKWEKKLEDAVTRVEELNLRFEKWFYVISGESFKKLRLARAELVEAKLPDTSNIGEQPESETEPVKKPSGLAYIDIERGAGAAAMKGDTVKVLYTGWLDDGTRFDGNEDTGEPFAVILGEGHVIKGWDEGLEGMAKGARRKLIIPPDLGYGEQGSGDTIPADATLVFDVEVVDIEKKNQ